MNVQIQEPADSVAPKRLGLTRALDLTLQGCYDKIHFMARVTDVQRD